MNTHATSDILQPFASQVDPRHLSQCPCPFSVTSPCFGNANACESYPLRNNQGRFAMRTMCSTCRSNKSHLCTSCSLGDMLSSDLHPQGQLSGCSRPKDLPLTHPALVHQQAPLCDSLPGPECPHLLCHSWGPLPYCALAPRRQSPLQRHWPLRGAAE